MAAITIIFIGQLLRAHVKLLGHVNVIACARNFIIAGLKLFHCDIIQYTEWTPTSWEASIAPIRPYVHNS